MISITKFDGTDYNRCSFEIKILSKQKQVLGIFDGTEEAPDVKYRTEFKAWKKQYGIAHLTILLAMETSLQQQYGVQKDSKALWDQLKEDYKSKVRLNVYALRDEMSALQLRDCENVQEYASKIQGYVNDFNLCVESSTSTMPMSKHSYYLMKGIPKDESWRVVTELMYDKIDTLSNKLEEVTMKMKAHKVRQQQDVDLESIELLALAKTQTHSENRNSKHSQKSRKSRDSSSESDGSSSENEKHTHHHTNWRDTQGCYRCHKVGHTSRYCPSTAVLESTAPPETAAATITSIENYWATVTNGERPSKESWYLDCATTSHICGDR